MIAAGLTNPARQLEHLVEAVLAQKIYAIEFAWGFTLLERHLGNLDWKPGTPDEEAIAVRLRRATEGLSRALVHIRAFAETADLGELDRGLAGARAEIYAFDELQALARLLGLEELAGRLFLTESLERPWQEQWEASVTRHQGESRAVFSCRSCGWELTYVQEVDSAQELEMPFAELTCPLCTSSS